MGVDNELDVPTALLTVTAAEAMACTSVFPAGIVPGRLNDSVISNRPPKVCDVELWNQTEADWSTGKVNWEVVRV